MNLCVFNALCKYTRTYVYELVFTFIINQISLCVSGAL